MILGIDYGKRKIGLALARGPFAEPHRVIRFKGEEEALRKVIQVIEVEQIEQIVVGISSGELAKLSKNFGNKLSELANIPVYFQDETLTTQEAQRLSFEAGIKRKKRKSLEDAYAAALILQNYLDES